MPGQSGSADDRQTALDDLVDALRRFTVESDVFIDVFARAHRLGRSDLNAIMWISTADAGRPMTVSRLAGLLGLGAPATTALVDRLEGAGHVRRERDPGDRRRVTVTMQDPALALAVQFFRPLGARMADAVADVDPAELRRTADLVRRLAVAVVDARTAASPPPPEPS